MLFSLNLRSQSQRIQGSFTVDRFGRRKILLAGTITMTCILALVTGLLSHQTNESRVQANAGIAFVYLFMVVFSFGWTAMYVEFDGFVDSTEPLLTGRVSTRLRSLAIRQEPKDLRS